MSRRDFLSRKGISRILNKVAPMPEMKSEALTAPLIDGSAVGKEDGIAERTVMEGFFSSPLTSYALLSEMPWDMLVDEANRLGVAHEGRSKIDIVRDIFLGTS